MSTVARQADAPEVAVRGPEAPVPWVAVAWFAGLVALCYAPMLARLFDQWMNDEDMGHGIAVPLVAGWIAWQRREQLLSEPAKPNYLGIALLLLGAVQLAIGTIGAELFLSRTAIVETLTGLVLVLGGTRALKILAFPLALLVFMIPIPGVIYNQITFPLQLFASQVAAFALDAIGIPVLRDGNVLELASQKLSVVEACSGIRSLLTLTFLSLVYAWMFDKKVWMRWALLAATVPIAILANAFRVTITGVMSEYDPALAHGVAHTASGWIIFMIALVMLVITHQVVNRVYGVFNGSARQ